MSDNFDNLKKNDHLLPPTFEEREALEKKRFKLAHGRDFFIIAGLALLALGFWVFTQLQGRGEVLAAEIYYYNELIDTVELTSGAEKFVSYPQDPNVVIKVNEDGSIQFDRSDCPDQICVHAGAIHTPEAFVACVPNGFLVSITADHSQSSQEVDIVN